MINLNALNKALVFFLILYIAFFTPFINEVFVPKYTRFFIPIPFFVIVFILNYNNSKNTLKIIFAILCLLLLLMLYWLIIDHFIVSNGILVLSSIASVLFVYPVLNKNVNFSTYLIKVWNYIIWISILSSIISFLFYNLLNGFGFQKIIIGDYTDENTLFNPILGVISEKTFLDIKVGRPAWFFAEPSYLGFFHGLNFFWFKHKNKIIGNKEAKYGYYLSIIAIIISFSIGTWISFTISYFFDFFKRFFDFINKKNILISLKKIKKYFFYSIFLFVFLLLIYNYNFFEYVNQLIDNFNNISSFEDRSNRIDSSIDFYNKFNILTYVFGSGPGSIENVVEYGESNSWLKSFIEEGALITMLYLIFLFIIILKKSKNAFLFFYLLVSFNSVVLMFSPLILIYILLLFILHKKNT